MDSARTYVWPTNSNTFNLVATVEGFADGLRTWNTVHNGAVSVTGTSVTAYPGSGHRTVTSTAPDGTHSISDFLYGRPVSVTAYDSGTTQLGQTTFAYDTHGHQNAKKRL